MRRATTEPDWSEEYFQQQEALRRSQGFKTLLDPSVFGACLAIGGRIVIGPLVLLLLFVGTGYLTDGTVFIGAEDSFFRFTALDLGMSGGCAGCVGACKVSFYKFTLFHGEAIASTPALVSIQALPPTESLYDFSVLTSDQLALAAELDDSGVICQGGRNEWGNAANVITGTSTQLLRIIEALDLSITPQNIRELELDANRTDGCITAWSLGTLTRLFRFPTSAGTEFGRISAIDISIFPDYAECRPEVEVNDELVGSKLALATNGEDLLAVYPEVLRLCPYSFGSSLPHVPRVRSTTGTETHYPTATVLQPLLNAYYGGCRVREVNTTGVFIEDKCEISQHWATYGLMVQSPDNIPLCTIGDVCVYNFYNTRWEWINSLDTTQPNRVVWTLNTFRNRYAATVAVSVLPGVVVMQMLLMGMISLYQVMSHKRSVLLTQVWAYRCQNGRMQVVYLAQVTYHLIYNSDMYLIGFATGTLTTESIANLTCCFYAFSYSFINLIKARSGDQKLDRHFRLTWETMQTVITFSVGAILYSIRREPQDYIFTENAEILRKNSVRGRIYCGLNDSCTLFKINLVVIVAVIALGLGVVALVASFLGRRMNARPKRAVIRSVRLSVSKARNLTKNPTDSATVSKVSVDSRGDKKYQEPEDDLTSFERNCIGAPFRKLFHDCDDMAYVTYNGKKCITVEALLLTGYLYYGEHIYQASSVMLLLVARLIPSKILRTFNVLLLRWYLDPKEGTLSHALSCTWFTASADNHKFVGSTPAA